MEKSKNSIYELDSISYFKKWNTSDFMGKSHLRYCKNPNIAIPGTQINAEKAHADDKAKDIKRFEDSITRAATNKRHKLFVKDLSAQLNARVYVVIQE